MTKIRRFVIPPAALALLIFATLSYFTKIGDFVFGLIFSMWDWKVSTGWRDYLAEFILIFGGLSAGWAILSMVAWKRQAELYASQKEEPPHTVSIEEVQPHWLDSSRTKKSYHVRDSEVTCNGVTWGCVYRYIRSQLAINNSVFDRLALIVGGAIVTQVWLILVSVATVILGVAFSLVALVVTFVLTLFGVDLSVHLQAANIGQLFLSIASGVISTHFGYSMFKDNGDATVVVDSYELKDLD